VPNAFWSGWILFAAIMMMLLGAYNVLQGLAAIFSDDYFVVQEDELLVFDFTAWGWITLIWGALLVLAGLGLFRGRQWARWTAAVVVGLNAVAQAAFLAHPLWNLIVVALCVLVIYALAVRWDDAQEDLTGPA
jgi:hypothetical protein